MDPFGFRHQARHVSGVSDSLVKQLVFIHLIKGIGHVDRSTGQKSSCYGDHAQGKKCFPSHTNNTGLKVKKVETNRAGTKSLI